MVHAIAMSPSPTCLRCLSRALRITEISPSSSKANLRSAPFSTTAPKLDAKKKKAPSPANRTGPTLKLSKNVRVTTGKPPQPGERKAMRKRVVLSNTNALEVRGLRDFDKVTARAASLEQLRGHVLGFSDDTVESLRALGAFKPTQGWSLFRRPATLIRDETVMLAREIEDTTSTNLKQSRLVLSGERGSGKSVLQLQAMALARIRGWIIIHIPEAQDLTSGHTSYQPSDTEGGDTSYIQPHYVSQLLSNIAKANSAILSSLQVGQKHNLPIPVQSNISLLQFVELGANDPSIAVPIWKAFLTEATAASQDGEGLQRPPILVTLDGLDFIMRMSAYLDPEVKPIHAHDLAFVADFIGLLNGKSPMKAGGMVLACTTKSNKPSTPTLDHIIATSHSGKSVARHPQRDSYAVVDERVEQAMSKARTQRIVGLSKSDTKGIMEYYALSGMFRGSVTDNLVGEKWSVSGGGNIGELEKGCVLQRF